MTAPDSAATSLDSVPESDDLFKPEWVLLDLRVNSRKRLFEELAGLIADQLALAPGEPDFDREQIFEVLLERERLGCTGVGGGVALPHGRLPGLEQPVIAMARLDGAVDYDAPDGEPVWFVVCLLAPMEAKEQHLNLLASLAVHFSHRDFIADIRRATNPDTLVQLFRAR